MYQRDEFDSYEIIKGKRSDPDNAWKGMYKDVVSAFTVAELGEMLPWSLDYNGWFYELETCKNGTPKPYSCSYVAPESWQEGEYITIITLSDKTEANARAKMLIYLLENNLIKLDNK